MIGEQSVRKKIAESLQEIVAHYAETERLSRIVGINRHFLEGTTVPDSGMTLEDVENELKPELERLFDLATDQNVEIASQSLEKI